MNKVTLEMELPVDCSDKEQVASFLTEQTINLVSIWKSVLSSYKDKGVSVPAVSVRGLTTKKVEESGLERKAFRTALLDHVLKYQPKVAVPQQVRAIQDLFALGKTAEEWIELFEQSRAAYPLTTWLTVKYKLNHSKVETEIDSPVRELNDDEVEELRKRVKAYG